jgi:hypothetical protein
MSIEESADLDVSEGERDDDVLITEESKTDPKESKQNEDDGSALPWKQLGPLCLIQICETFASSGIFAYGGECLNWSEIDVIRFDI